MGGERRSTRGLCGLAGLAALSFALSASAGTTAYRCTQDGQITLTDKPCPRAGAVTSTPTTAGTTAPPVAAPQDPRLGNWQGQAQFAATQNGQNIEDAHAVVATALTFGPDGKISSAPAENGCTLLGLWSPEVTPRLLTVDLTLSGCRYAGLNRRYSGSLNRNLCRLVSPTDAADLFPHPSRTAGDALRRRGDAAPAERVAMKSAGA